MMLAVASTQNHPYGLQLLTFWLALLPVVLLVALIIATIVWRRYRHRRSHHTELMKSLMNK
jgi:heme/copper-type cytochrome/quinol oxidase subunit 2